MKITVLLDVIYKIQTTTYLDEDLLRLQFGHILIEFKQYVNKVVTTGGKKQVYVCISDRPRF